MSTRPIALAAALLLAACAQTPPAADPATVAANAREQAKLAALTDCHLRAQDEAGGTWGAAAFAALIDRCMEGHGYQRGAPIAAAELGG
jgi:outer membrane PBP1 activator LpoA protein